MSIQTMARTGLGLTTLALILTACGGSGNSKPVIVDPTEPPHPTVQTGSISGQLQKITATTVRPMTQIVEGPEFVAKVNGQQQFDLTLPGASIVEGKYKSDLIPLKDVFEGCSVSPSTDVQLLLLNSLQTNTGQELKAIIYNNNTKSYSYWWYADKSATTNVNGSCLAGTFNNQTIALTHGWNMVTWTTNGSNVTINVQAPTTKRTVWTPTSIEGQSPDGGFDLPWRQLDKYRNH